MRAGVGGVMEGLPGGNDIPFERRPVVPVVTSKVSWTGLGRLYGKVFVRDQGLQFAGLLRM